MRWCECTLKKQDNRKAFLILGCWYRKKKRENKTDSFMFESSCYHMLISLDMT